MKLLFIVLNSSDKLEEVLEGLIEVGITGATVVDSVGMGRIIEGVPLFAGMRNIFRSAKPRNNIIFSVIRSSQAPETMDVLDKILGCSMGKGSGIAFLLPIDSVIGVCKDPD
jgi:nitrogen regulatory protein P-II 1